VLTILPTPAALSSTEDDLSAFSRSRACFESLVEWTRGEEAAGFAHDELETQLQVRGRDLLRKLLQDHLDLRARREVRLDKVVGADGVVRGSVEQGHRRGLRSVFGLVTVTRLAYRRKGQANLYPADTALNLPQELHSHGLRRLAAAEAASGSIEEAQSSIERSTGERLGKRQIEEMVGRAGADFDAFYAKRTRAAGAPHDVLVLTCDGKGIVMRPQALRPATAQAAEQAAHKLQTRLSPGEKRNRKRMAEVGGVYDATPAPRTPVDVLARSEKDREVAPGPVADNKWLVASVVEEAASVVSRVFDEAERRDRRHQRTWVALVDGNKHQIERIEAEAQRREVEVSIVVDFIHVLEYLWQAARSFFEDDTQAESWVLDKALEILDGHAGQVAAAIRRKATYHGLDPAARAGADRCADYLSNKAPYLDYATALERGWPIATGVIEGACRHLVKDRMDLTGARWGLEGAEAVLRLRALVTNGDFDAYWRFHLSREQERVHFARYAPDVLPMAA
jgi:predicted nucleic acid-binding protein